MNSFCRLRTGPIVGHGIYCQL